MINIVSFLLIFDELFASANFYIFSNFNIMKSQGGIINIMLIFCIFSRYIFKYFICNGSSFLKIMWGQFVNHGHHKILIILANRCSL